MVFLVIISCREELPGRESQPAFTSLKESPLFKRIDVGA
jgi:hypothetical protein